MSASSGEIPPQGIAVIGLAGRFPGAPDVERFWRNLLAGTESITFFHPDELRQAGVAPELLADPAYVRARAVMDDPSGFDAAFFGYSPREAETMDPQHRVLLECAHQALEHAGYDPARYPGPIGVFAGTGTNTYLLFALRARRELLEAAGAYQTMLGSDDHFLATRLSYKLGLRGPSLTVQTACSTSLVAVHLAVQSLLNGESDMALAGGVRIAVPQRAGYLFQTGGIFSPDGHCRPFDAASQGTLDGDGVGIVVLKRLADALADGDHVHAVILGTAMNNDGSLKVGYTAPSVEGQAEVIAMAQAVAEVEPGSIGYVEAHGTATPLGDPIEVEALRKVFAPAAERQGFCVLGSVKSNVGHLDAAAGVASLIKAVLAVERGVIPPTVHFEAPNPRLGLEDGPFVVSSRPREWAEGLGVRRAGVSSFGIGGTNAHVVLEEPPAREAAVASSRPWQLLVLSAATSSALEASTAALAGHLEDHPGADLADVAFTLQVGRGVLAHRRAVVCRGAADAAAALRSLEPRRVLARVQEPVSRTVSFLLPGQGSQHPGMGGDLYRSEPTFRAEVDRSAEILRPLLGLDLRTVLFPAGEGEEAAARLRRTALAQPALFVIEHALARLWMEWGVRPAALLGHSIGEYVAACLAGVFTLEDALRLVAERGRLMQELPAGAMLAVPLAEAEVRVLLGPGLALAAVNTPALCVVAGGLAEVEALAARLEAGGAQARRLHTSHAFHSPAMDPILDRFRAACAGVRRQPPSIPFVSNLTGTWIRPAEAIDPDYWTRHLRETVRFSAGLETLFARAGALLEVGPGRALATLALRHPAKPTGLLVQASLPAAERGAGEGAEEESALRALGQLWLAGAPVDWHGLHAHEPRRRVALPTYPFDRKRFWVEPRAGSLEARSEPSGEAGWFWTPGWKQVPPAARALPAGGEERWWVLADETGFGGRLADRLEALGRAVTVVTAGEAFQQAGGRIEVRPGEPDDYRRLLSTAGSPDRIAHLWSLAPGGDVRRQRELGFDSLLALARVLGERGAEDVRPLHLGILSTGVQSVAGEVALAPGKATLLGPAAVLPQELAGVTCQAIDVILPAAGSRRERELIDVLLAELAAAPDDPVVAFRGTGRWVRTFEPLPLGPAASTPVREGGTYLITGGLGGVGLELAGELARAGRVRLVLLGRSAPSPAASRRVLALEAADAEVLVLRADVADRESLGRALGAARQRFGPIHGVIHAAGVPGGGLAQLRTGEEASAVLAPKVEGTLLLDELIGEELDFFLLCSSLNAVLGGPGQVDYAAANAFLGAFAQERSASGERPVVAVDWDAWRGVGMASLGKADQEAAEDGVAEPFAHPLLTERLVAETDGGEQVFVSRLRADTTWILDEHRLGGYPVVPGTTYLEMAGAAFRGAAGAVATDVQGMELRDVVFLAPMVVADGETREVRTVLRRNGGGFHFSVRSRDGERGWQEHAMGVVGAGTGGVDGPVRHDLGPLLAAGETRLLGEEYREDLRQTGLGPRWETLRQVWLHDGDVLGWLELAPELAADVDDFHLHPALLDAATSFAETYVPRAAGDYLPLSYKRLQVRGPLPRRFHSHVRPRAGGAPGWETLTFDLSIVDEEGLERVRVEEFTLKRVDAGRAIRGGAEPGRAVAAGAVPEEGLSAAEAVEAFRRILGGLPSPARIAVSARPLPEEIERARALTLARLAGERGAPGGHARPDLDTAYAAPRTETERRIAAIFQGVLGVAEVGVFDDFFELGGHSLLGTQVMARLREELRVELPLGRLFEAPTIADLAALVDGDRDGGAAPADAGVLPRVPRGGDLALSFTQERFWFFDRLQSSNPFYNVCQAARLDGRLDVAALAGALRTIVRRHEALRTVFAEVDGRPVQRVSPEGPAALPLVDLSALPEARREAVAERLAIAAAARAFDLGELPLWEVQLYRLAPERHVLALTMQHIVSDGWSLMLFLSELAALYRAALAAEPSSPLPGLAVQYADYAAWQRDRLRGPELEAQLADWRAALAGLPLLDFPTDRPRPAIQTFRGASDLLTLAPERVAGLKRLAQSESATLFMALLSGLALLLGRHAGQEDVAVGAPIAGRGRGELEGLIGVFLNTLVLRADLSGEPGFRALLGRMRRVTLDAYARQDVPFERLVQELRPERDLSRPPLFQVTFNMQDFPRRDLEMPGLRLSIVPIREVAARFDLTLYAAEVEGAVLLELEYNRDLFDPPTAARLLRGFELLLAGVVADPDLPVMDLPLLTAGERAQILVEWNDTRTAWPEARLHELFEAQARHTPGAVALVFEEGELRYGELNARANRLARALRRRGVGRGVRVGLCVERSAEMVVGLLGVLKAGGAYVPLDPSYPRDRLAFMLADARVPVLLTQERLLDTIGGTAASTFCLDAEWESVAAESAADPDWPGELDELAYVIYTSGSTGLPKGAMNSHRAICNRLLWMQEAYGLTAGDRVLQKTPFSFDVSVWEFFWPLATGARLVLARPGGHQDPEYLARLIARAGITTAHFVPSMLQVFLEVDEVRACAGLRRVICSGEALPAQLERRFFARFPGGPELHNLYGPTEAAVDVTAWRCAPGSSAAAVPIGRPIANTSTHVLDARLTPVPIGVSGELYLGGVQLARGYLGRPDLTAERFVPDPFAALPGARLYRTGDRVRRLPGGEIVFLGRLDHQVKIRGVRIELGEIESVLAAHPAVREAAVLALDDAAPSVGTGRLVAYVVPVDGVPLDARALRRSLAERLPEAMVPSAFVRLDALPLSPNGKLDRKALPAPGRSLGPGFVAPRGPVEEVLAGIWTEVLGAGRAARVGAHDDFFELGGHSLMATQVLSRVRRAFGVEVPLRSLFEAPTLAALAERIALAGLAAQGSPTASTEPIVALPRTGEPPLSFAQRRLWFLDQLDPGSPAYNIASALHLTGGLSVHLLQRIFAEVVRRHEALRTTFANRGGEPVQVIAAASRPELPVVDLSALTPPEGWTRARELAREEALRPFDLERGPLLRFALVRLAAADHLLLLTLHHIVSDGWSLGLLVREVTELYRAFSAADEPRLPSLGVQYADYALWQRGRLRGEVLERELAYWRGQLAGLPSLLALPTDRPRPPAQSFRGGQRVVRLPAELAADLRALAQRESATLFMTLLSGLQVLLARYSAQEHFAVGTPISGRNHLEVEDLIGFFVNTLVLRGDLSGSPGFRELLGRTRMASLDAHAHQEVPFEKLVEELAPQRSRAHSPLFQVMLALQNTPRQTLSLGEVGLRDLGVTGVAAKFDFTLSLEEIDGEVAGTLVYAAELFDGATMERFAGHYSRLLAAAMAAPDTPVAELPLLGGGEAAQVLVQWNDTRTEVAAGRPLHERIERWAAATPEADAVVCGAERLGFAELNRRANRLARRLAASGARPETRVALCMERSADLIVGLLATLKTGAAFVVLDPAQPAARLAWVVRDADPVMVLAREAAGAGLPEDLGIPVLWLDRAAGELSRERDGDLGTPVDLEQPAYLVYTSGSTGAPKGTAIRHGAVLNLLAALEAAVYRGCGPGLRVSVNAPLFFDGAIKQVIQLANGRPLVIVPDEARADPVALGRYLGEQRVAVFDCTPVQLKALLHTGWGSAGGAVPELVLVGGEAMDPALWEELGRLAGTAFFNVYGPSECTVDTTVRRVGPDAPRPLIGRPIANVRAHVLAGSLAAQPIGVPGELCIGGAGLARGYQGRPDLTAEKFVPDPFAGQPGARLYRTGDLVRRLPGGELEFLGRIDHQVKLRGFRIELGEIETALASHPAVLERVVLVREDSPGRRLLVAYVVPVPQADALTADELRAFLRQKLPGYMVPAAFVVLERLPLSANGKLDRQALPAPERDPEQGFVAPHGPVEEALAAIWAEVLGAGRVGAHDDFFELGGHSLLATQVLSRVREELAVEVPLRALLEAPTVAALAEQVALGRRTPSELFVPLAPIAARAPSSRGGSLPLSFAQQRLWFLDCLAPGNPFYNVYAEVRLTGPFDVDALRRAFREIVRRHESLRTTFRAEGGQPFQVISPVPECHVPLIDLEALPGAAVELARLSGAESLRPFDLARGPLLRVNLVRLGDRRHALLVNLHHIISDGWSLGILERELAALYGAFSQGEPSPLPELPIQYGDFAVWQREWLQGERLEAQLGYWRQQLAGAAGVLELPYDHPRPAAESFRGGTRSFELPAPLVRGLTALTRGGGATLPMTLLAGFKSLLARYSGRRDLAVGVAIANRTRREVESLIGFFVNTLVVRSDLTGSPGFGELITRVRGTALEAYAYQDLPFERLVEELQPERHLGHNPLIQVMFGYQNFPRAEVEVRGLVLSPPAGDRVDAGTAKFDLTLFLFEQGDRLQGLLEYNSELFEATTIQRLVRHFESLLAAAVASPETPVARLPLSTEAERHQLALEWNATGSAYPAEASLGELFESQAHRAPDAPALLFGDGVLSYGELNRRANRLAHRLRRLGVGPEGRVGLCLERSPELIVGLLGILKAGGVYVPLDADYPRDRLAFMMADSGLRVLVGDEGAAARLPGDLLTDTVMVFVDAGLGDDPDCDPPATLGGDSLAYVMYTSGSTGRPKGVAVTHRAVARLVRETGYIEFGADQVFLQFAPISFDASTLEVWGPLLNGGRLALMPPHALSLAEMGQELERYGVTALWLTAGLFHQFVEHHLDLLRPVRQLLAGGDALSVSHVRRVLAGLPDTRLINGYGPTENTTFTCCYPLGRAEHLGASVPIGRPIANTWVHLLDPEGQPVPIGVAGELCTGGAGLARGYLGRPGLTAERFVPDPFAGVAGGVPGGRLYRTGDLARRLPDGRIEFLGRIDHQVKLRGFRIELGEIEASLVEHPAVLQSVVLAREDSPGDRRLVAYVVPDPAYGGQVGEVEGDQVSQWSELFEDLYQDEAAEADPTFNVIGWNSSYTELPLPREEMEDWLEDNIDRIRACSPRRVLEIGCGTGMILFRIAPGCEHYTGTDISGRVLGYVDRQLEGAGLERSRVQLLRRSAERFEGMAADSFDTVILSSVVQYFPSADYLAEVIARAVEVVRPGGAIFLGDLRSLPLLDAFHASVELFQAAPETPLEDLRRKVRVRRLQENELAVAPAFFSALRERLPKIGRVEIYPKRGRAHNELTAFRYQVVLRIGDAGEPREIPWLDWRAAGLTPASLRRLLEEEKPDLLGLRGVANARVAEAAAATRALLEDDESVETAGDLRRLAAAAAAGAGEPQDLWDLGLELPYDVELSWASPGSDGSFEAVLKRRGGAGEIAALLPAPGLASPLPPLGHYTSNPQQGRFARRIAPELRAFLAERLPDYMVPSSFLLLDAFPLSPNGKVDRRRLPSPNLGRHLAGKPLVAPRNDVEERLAAIWRELLGVERIGVDDDFFALGGHSLLATQAVSRMRIALGVELPLRTFFEVPTVAALAEEVAALRQGGGAAAAPPIVPVPREGPLPLSFAQERLWFIDLLDARRLAYNESAAFRLDGPLDVAAFRWSLDEVVRRHEALRTAFPEVDGAAVQRILPAVSFEIPSVDLRELPPPAREEEARRLAADQARRRFELAEGPLVRGVLVRLDEREHAVLFFFHHIVFDGWSISIFVRELSAFYGSRISGEAPTLPPLPVQYADFAVWQRRWLKGEVLEGQLAYWRERLAGVAVLDLPTDRPRPTLPAAPGGWRPVLLDPDLAERLRAFSRSRGITLFMALLAAFQALLHRLTGQADVAVGTPVANRNRAEVEGLIGFFVNMLVLRTDLAGNPPFARLVDQVREVALGAYAHQDLPFEKLVWELQPDRDLRRTPLFQVGFQVFSRPADELELPGLTPHPFRAGARFAKFDLNLSLSEDAAGLSGALDYDADLLDGTTVLRTLGHFEALLEAVVAAPSMLLSDIQLLSQGERHQLLAEFGVALHLPPEPAATLPGLFAHQAARTPDAPALLWRGEEWTFRDVAARAERLAGHLRALGAGPETLVGVCAERGPELVCALLGVLAAGAAYLPLDPAWPRQRLELLIEDARAPFLLVSGGLAGLVPAGAARLLTLEDLLREASPASAEAFAPPLPENLAYVIYTSGSTGRPKGVAVRHRSVVALLDWSARAFAPEERRRILAATSVCFDLSVFELFLPLTTGATVVLAGGPLEIASLAAASGATLVNTVPSVLAEVLRSSPLPASVRTVALAGEPLTPALAAELHRSGTVRRVVNLYGPSEDTTYSTRAEIVAGATGAISIGRVIDGSRVYLLDAGLRPVPLGARGELYLGGEGLARGYLHRPDRTAEAFLPDPLGQEPGERIYRTGDLARFRPDGGLELLGRIDHQVKVRGLRIELGEIEAALERHPAVRQSVVVVTGNRDEERRLVAYVVPSTADAPTAQALRSFLAESLPAPVVPGLFVTLESLPLTPSGKLDRRALPAPGLPEVETVAPRDEVELRLARVWEELLEVCPIGVRDNFFALGGHSLLVVRLMGSIERQLGRKLPVSALMEAPTVERMALLIRQETDVPRSLIVPIQAGNRERPPLFLIHPVGGNVFCYLPLAHPGGLEGPIYGLQAPLPEAPGVPWTIEILAERYLAALREVQPDGPYRLAGWSMGGVVAFEMARQLEAQGSEIALAALIDAGPPVRELAWEDPRNDLARFAHDLHGLAGLDAEKLALSPEVATLDGLRETEAVRALLPGDAGAGQLRELFALFCANRRALGAYRPRPYGGRLTLIQAEETIAALPADAAGTWRELAAGGAEVHVLAGDHYSLLKAPRVAELSRLLAPAAASRPIPEDHRSRSGRGRRRKPGQG